MVFSIVVEKSTPLPLIENECFVFRKNISTLTEVDDVDFATNRLAVLSHGLAVCALRDLEKRERGRQK